jgi:hypothetical protein
LEPWAEERSDFATGTQIMHADAAAGLPPKEPVEYMHYLRRNRQPKLQTQEQMQATWDAICEVRRRQEEERTKNPC